MPKIADLSVVDLRGACAQIERHLIGPLGFERARVEVKIGPNEVTVVARVSGKDVPTSKAFERPYWIQRSAMPDDDWQELLDKVWADIGKHARPEVREISAFMEKLGSAIEILDKSRLEFAADLTAGIKAVRDDAGARLIEFQGAAE